MCDVSPELADKLIELNTHNRKYNNRAIARYTSLMKRGKWAPLTRIKITKEGWISDGQHRLLAIIKSGITLKEVEIVIGVETKDQITTDMNVKRSLGDFLEIDGYKRCNLLASTIRKAHAVDSGEGLAGLPDTESGSHIIDETPIDLLEYFYENEEEMLYLTEKVQKYRMDGLYGDVLGHAVIALYRIDREAADSFLQN